ncbi:MAG: DASS family sodium-coupled anion symporter [Acidobacteriota bacterium]|nr:DASS family sodium-coupled anion symporter [Acidobacteriota bacterium]
MPTPSKPANDTRAVLTLLGAITLLLVVHWLPLPAPLEREGELVALTGAGKTCLAILLFAVTLWVGEAMPFAVTSLLVLILIPTFGITDFANAVNAGFGNPLIVFFIGVLFLSTGFTFSGLGTRMVLHVLRLAGTRTDRVLLGFLVVGALLSMWITDMAVAAVMLPLGVGVLKDAGLKPLESNYGRALMISCAYGPLIGGIATPAGTAANLIALSYLEEIAGLSISFGQWMALGVPAAVLMIPVGWWLLMRLFPPEIETLPYANDELDQKLADLGPLQPVERKTLAIFALTITAWLVTPWLADLTGGRIDPPVQAVALFGGLTLFLPTIRVMSWKDAQANMDWGGVMLIVAGLSLGLMVFETGAARWLAQLLLGNLVLIPSLLRPFVIVIAVSLLHLLFSSNTVTGSLIMPILLALAIDLGLDAWTIAAPAAFTSTLAFILVTESPTNVLPYSAGYFSIRDMAKVGIWMTLGAAVCVTISLTIVGPFTR